MCECVCVCVSSGTLTLYSCPNIWLQIHDCERFVPRGCENGKVCVWTVEQPTSYTKAFLPKSQSMDSQVRATELAGSPAHIQGLRGLSGDCNCRTVCVLHSQSWLGIPHGNSFPLAVVAWWCRWCTISKMSLTLSGLEMLHHVQSKQL